ncbi:hypothetical protein EJB05_51173 [Eragrostis curvula]|uniref:Secreted protein n=1 Tax=Eragrostis curvula TaxID=38414 RepID=A0A5J9SWG0_9POAL|nr:hypothetical protein EJB05_51173 [Eragrostis curvula]
MVFLVVVGVMPFDFAVGFPSGVRGPPPSSSFVLVVLDSLEAAPHTTLPSWSAIHATSSGRRGSFPTKVSSTSKLEAPKISGDVN